MEVDSWNCDASQPIVLNINKSLLGETIFEPRPKPGKDETGNVYCRCSYKIVPIRDQRNSRLPTRSLLIPRGKRVVTMPEKHNYEDDYGEEVRCLEELVAEISFFN